MDLPVLLNEDLPFLIFEDWESENYPDEEFLKALETMG